MRMSSVGKKPSTFTEFLSYCKKNLIFYELVGIILLFPITILLMSWLIFWLIPSFALVQTILILVTFFGTIIASSMILHFFSISDNSRLENMFRWTFIIVGIAFVMIIVLQLLDFLSTSISLSLQLGLIGSCAGVYVSLSVKGLFLLHDEWKTSQTEMQFHENQNHDEGE